jgi:hypothetical protein
MGNPNGGRNITVGVVAISVAILLWTISSFGGAKPLEPVILNVEKSITTHELIKLPSGSMVETSTVTHTASPSHN